MSEEQASTRSLRAEIELLFKADEGGSTLDKFKQDINAAADAMTALDGKLNLETLKKDMTTLMESLSKKGKNSISLAVTDFRDNLMKQITNRILDNNFVVDTSGSNEKFVISVDKELIRKIKKEFVDKIQEKFDNPEGLFPPNFSKSFKLGFNANDIRRLAASFNTSLSKVLSNGVDFYTESVKEVLEDGTFKLMPAKDLLKLTFDKNDMQKIVGGIKDKLVTHMTDPKNVSFEDADKNKVSLRIDVIDKYFETINKQITTIKNVIEGELRAVQGLETLNVDDIGIKGTAKSILDDIKTLKREIESINLKREKNALNDKELTDNLRSLSDVVYKEVHGFIKDIVANAADFDAKKIGAKNKGFKPQLTLISKLISEGVTKELDANIKSLIDAFGYQYTTDEKGNVELKKELSKMSGKISKSTVKIVEKIAKELSEIMIDDEGDIQQISGLMRSIRGVITDTIRNYTVTFAKETGPEIAKSYNAILTFFKEDMLKELNDLLTQLKAKRGKAALSTKDLKKLTDSINNIDFSAVEEQTESLTKAIQEFIKKTLMNMQKAIKKVGDGSKNPVSPADIALLNKHVDQHTKNLVITSVNKFKQVMTEIADNAKEFKLDSLIKKEKDSINNALKKSLVTMVKSMLDGVQSSITPLNMSDDIRNAVLKEFSALSTKILSSIDFSSANTGKVGIFSENDLKKISDAGKQVADDFTKEIKEAVKQQQVNALNAFKNNYRNVVVSISNSITRELNKIKQHLEAAEKNNTYGIKVDFDSLFSKISQLTLSADAGDAQKVKNTLQHIKEVLSQKVRELIDSVMKADGGKQVTEKDKEQLNAKLNYQTKKLLTYITNKSLALIESINKDLKTLGVTDFTKKDAEQIKKSFKGLAAKLVSSMSTTTQSLASSVKIPKEVKDELKKQLEAGLSSSLKNVKLNIGKISKVDINIDQQALNSMIKSLSGISELAKKLNLTIGDNVSILTNELDATIKKILASRKGMSVKDYLKSNKELTGTEGLTEALNAAMQPAGNELGKKFLFAAHNYFQQIQTKIKSTEFTLDPLHGEGLVDVVNKMMNNTFKAITDKIGKSLTSAMGGVMKQISGIDMSSISIDRDTLQSLLNNTTPSNRRVVVNRDTSSQTDAPLNIIKIIQDATTQRINQVSKEMPMLQKNLDELKQQKLNNESRSPFVPFTYKDSVFGDTKYTEQVGEYEGYRVLRGEGEVFRKANAHVLELPEGSQNPGETVLGLGDSFDKIPPQARDFILQHEVSHVQLGHTKQSRIEDEILEQVGMIPKDLYGKSELERLRLTAEIEADNLALSRVSNPEQAILEYYKHARSVIPGFVPKETDQLKNRLSYLSEEGLAELVNQGIINGEMVPRIKRVEADPLSSRIDSIDNIISESQEKYDKTKKFKNILESINSSTEELSGMSVRERSEELDKRRSKLKEFLFINNEFQDLFREYTLKPDSLDDEIKRLETIVKYGDKIKQIRDETTKLKNERLLNTEQPKETNQMSTDNLDREIDETNRGLNKFEQELQQLQDVLISLNGLLNGRMDVKDLIKERMQEIGNLTTEQQKQIEKLQGKKDRLTKESDLEQEPKKPLIKGDVLYADDGSYIGSVLDSNFDGNPVIKSPGMPYGHKALSHMFGDGTPLKGQSVIVVSTEFEDLPEEQRRSILYHESGHIKKGHTKVYPGQYMEDPLFYQYAEIEADRYAASKDKDFAKNKIQFLKDEGTWDNYKNDNPLIIKNLEQLMSAKSFFDKKEKVWKYDTELEPVDSKSRLMELIDKDVNKTSKELDVFTKELQQLQNVLSSLDDVLNGTLSARDLVGSLPTAFKDLISVAHTRTQKDSKPSDVFDPPQTGGEYREMDTESFETARNWYSNPEDDKDAPARFKIGELEVDRSGMAVYDNITPPFNYSDITSLDRPNLLEKAMRGRPSDLTPSVDEVGRDITLPEGFGRRPDGVGYSKLERLYRTSEIFRQSMVNKYSNYKIDDRAKNESMAYVKEFDMVVPYLRDEITRLYEVLGDMPKGEENKEERNAILKQIEMLKSKIDLEFDRLRNLDQLLIDRFQGTRLEDSEVKAQKNAIDQLALEKERMTEFQSRYSMLLDDKETDNLKSEIAQQMARLQTLSESRPKGQMEVMDSKNELSDIKRQLQVLRRRYGRIEKEQNITTKKENLINSIQSDPEVIAGLQEGDRQGLIDRIKGAQKKQEIEDIKKTISEAKKAGKSSINKDAKFEEKATKKMDSVGFMYELEQVRAGELIKQYENKLSSSSMGVVRNDVQDYLDEVQQLRNTKLTNLDDLQELEKAITRISEKMKSLKSKWNDMLHDENVFYGSTKSRNQLQGMKDLGIVDSTRIDEVETILDNARTANELKFAKDAVDQLRQEQAEALKGSLLERKRGKLGVDKAQFISDATAKDFSIDTSMLDVITQAESNTSTKEDIADARKVLSDLVRNMSKAEKGQNKEKDLKQRAELFLQAQDVLTNELSYGARRKLQGTQLLSFAGEANALNFSKQQLQDLISSIGGGELSADEIRGITRLIGEITNKFADIKKKVDMADKENKFQLKKDKMYQDIAKLQMDSMITDSEADSMRNKVRDSENVDTLSRVGLDLQSRKDSYKRMVDAKNAGDATMINEQRRQNKATNLNEALDKLEYNAAKNLTRGTTEFDDFLNQINALRGSVTSASSMDVSDDTSVKVMGNEMAKLNGILTALKNRLTVQTDQVKRGELVATDPVLASRNITPSDIERILLSARTGIQMAGKVEVDNARATWSAVITNEVGQREKLVGTIDRNINALMKHANSLDRAGEVIAAQAAQFKRIDVSDGFEYARGDRDGGADGEEVDNLSRFQNSLINTMRYMFAGTLVGYPSMMFYKGFESYKESEFQMTKAQQNFMFKDPDFLKLAATRLEAKREDGLISEQDYNDKETYDRMLNTEQANLQTKAMGGNQKQLRNYSFMYGVNNADAAKAYQIVSRRLDDPEHVLAYTKQVLKARSLEDVDIEQFTLGFEALSAQWGLGTKQIEHATNMMIKSANLTQAKIEDILLTQTRAGAIFKDTSPNLYKEDPMKALAQAITMSSFFVQATARSGKEGGTFYKSFLEKVYSDNSVKQLRAIDEAVKPKTGEGEMFEGIKFDPFERREDGSYKQRDAMDILGDILYANRNLEKNDRDDLLKPFVAQWHIGSAAAVESFLNELDEQLVRETVAMEKINEMRKEEGKVNEKEISNIQNKLNDPSLGEQKRQALESQLEILTQQRDRFKTIEGTGQKQADGKKAVTPADILRFQSDETYRASEREIMSIQAVNMGTYKFKTQQISTMFENASASFFELLKPHFTTFATHLNSIMRYIGEGAGSLVSGLTVAALALQVFGAKYLRGFVANQMTQRRDEKDAERIDVLRKDLDNQAKANTAKKRGLEAQVQDAFDNTAGDFATKEAARQAKIEELKPQLLQTQAESREINSRTKLLQNEQNRLGIDDNLFKNPMNQIPEGYEDFQLDEKEVDQAYRERTLASGVVPNRLSQIGKEIDDTTRNYEQAKQQMALYESSPQVRGAEKRQSMTQKTKEALTTGNFNGFKMDSLPTNEIELMKLNVKDLNRELQRGAINLDRYADEMRQLGKDYGMADRQADAFADEMTRLNRNFDEQGRKAAQAASNVEKYTEKMENLARRRDLAVANINDQGRSISGSSATQQLAAATGGSATASSLSNIGSNQENATVMRRTFSERFADSRQVMQADGGMMAAMGAFFGGRFARNDDGTLKDAKDGGTRETREGRDMDDDDRTLGQRLKDGTVGNIKDFIKTAGPALLAVESGKFIFSQAMRSKSTAAELKEADAAYALSMERTLLNTSDEKLFSENLDSLKQGNISAIPGLFGDAVQGAIGSVSRYYNEYVGSLGTDAKSIGNKAADKAMTRLTKEGLTLDDLKGQERYGQLFEAEIAAVQSEARVTQLEDTFRRDLKQTFLYDSKGDIKRQFGKNDSESGIRYGNITTSAEAQELISKIQQDTSIKTQSVTAEFEVKKSSAMLNGLKEDSEEITKINRELFQKQKELLQEQLKKIQAEIDLFMKANPGAKPEDNPALAELQKELQQTQSSIADNTLQIQQSVLADKINRVARISDTLNFERQSKQLDNDLEINQAVLGGTPSDSDALKSMEKEDLQDQNAIIDTYLPQLKEKLSTFNPNIDTEREEYRKIFLEIKQLEVEQVANLVKIKDTLASTKSTFNLPSGMKAITYYEAITQDATAKNMSILKGDTVINITVEGDVDNEERINKIAKAVDRVVNKEDRTTRGLVDTITRRQNPTSIG